MDDCMLWLWKDAVSLQAMLLQWGSRQGLQCHLFLLLRNAMHIADYNAVARCPSVRPSVTRRYSVETDTYIRKLFWPLDSHTILVFAYQTV